MITLSDSLSAPVTAHPLASAPLKLLLFACIWLNCEYSQSYAHPVWSQLDPPGGLERARQALTNGYIVIYSV